MLQNIINKILNIPPPTEYKLVVFLIAWFLFCWIMPLSVSITVGVILLLYVTYRMYVLSKELKKLDAQFNESLQELITKIEVKRGENI